MVYIMPALYFRERSYGGKIFKSREHTERLRNSANVMDFDLPISDDEIDAAKQAVIKANDIVDGYVRAYCWRGSEMMAVSAQRTTQHLAIAAGSGRAILTLKPR